MRLFGGINTDKIKGAKVIAAKIKEAKITRILGSLLSEYWLLCFYILLFTYMELLYRLWTFKTVGFDYFFAFVFALSGGSVLYIITSMFSAGKARIATNVITFLVTLVYGVQLIYYSIFRTPLSLVSLGAAGDASQFWDIVVEHIMKNLEAMIMLFAPFALIIDFRKDLQFSRRNITELSFVLLFCVITYSSAVVCVSVTGDDPTSQNSLYFGEVSPELSMNKLGVLTTMRLDLQKLAADTLHIDISGNLPADGKDDDNDRPELPDAGGETGNEATVPDSAVSGNEKKGDNDSGGEGNSAVGQDTAGVDSGETAIDTPIPAKPYNVMDIDFETLLASGESDPLYPINKYFSLVPPTETNKYTGMFKGCNLIMFTAEGFSPYAVDPVRTPTLYMMATQGFHFTNFYNPVWGVSTSDGEYVACTGLIPKGGVWSFYKSGSIDMPFTMGNQFKKLGYLTKAYHNHTYTYYKRDVSHPNMGYDYKGVGNGLVVKKTWPESDVEMIDVTAGEYMDKQPFHTYYMTVSGHMNYNFFGNYMASKNKSYVESLPYSDSPKAYLACQLELEFAMKDLLDKLEAAGIAENTVIVLSADHYPYGLEKQYLDELAGHEVESNFELYKSTLIIWKKGMQPVVVDKPCASLDIIPTVSNLFGLDYDSRLLMGTDILSNAPPLVIFSNRSWITDKARKNTVSGTVTFTDGTAEDQDYVKKINRLVSEKFKYSAKILETDYYGKVLK
ncbi:MAG TPA: LTA synthase family protein [Clostridia bacterium]|nr:LTA synthase family protein [Clostridia bacterium]